MKDSTVNYKDEIEAALTDKQRDDLDRLKERLEAATGVEEFAPKNNISIFVNCRGHDYDVIKQLHDDLGEKFFKGFEEGNKFKEYTKQFFCWLFGVEYTPKLGINSVNDTGHTPLHIVAGNLQLQKLLIEELGADVNARSANKNDTPIFYAVVTPFIEAVDHLVQSGARVDVVNNKGQNLLHVLSMDHHPSANRDSKVFNRKRS